MIFAPFERRIAFRYLRARRKEGFISVIAGFSLAGIALGVATLIIVMAVMNGFRTELLTRILGVGGHITVHGVGGPLTDFDTIAERLRQVPGVVHVAPLVSGQAMATVGPRASGVLIRGMRAEDLADRPILAGNIVAGSLAALEGGDALLVGARFAQNNRIGIGDTVTLIAPSGNVTAFGTMPRSKAYQVVGLFDVGMHEYDANILYMPFEAAQIFFREQGRATGLEVMIDHPDAVRGVSRRIVEALGPQVRMTDWQQANASFFTAIQVERNVMFLILTLIILVAAFNVISGLIMLVKDKGRDIAILRSMGASRGAVMRIFLLAGASVGVVGTAAGLGLGLAFAGNIETIQGWVERLTGAEVFAAEIYFLSRLPAEIDPREVGLVVVISLVLSLLATLYPSWRAARLDPVEALRYE